ncbi:MAG: septum formation inhibitor Maf [Planctomycetes bacterium]|nr:septum formation inhibitor Maf [Planctomycetota bacterium]MBM4079860.1 septum formation inhibitor Maf [Planctomycetota bacterium]MBM4085840.1 septum formation inhibitor Maf [Planctomycetota bacterium]
MRRLVLASASPRRRQLLAQLGCPFDVAVPEADEQLDASVSPRELAQRLARLKAESVAKTFPDALILGADTLVATGGELIGKPADRQDAVRILSRLSGTRHRVITGICILDAASGQTWQDAEETWVTMRPMSRAEIEAYVDSGEAMGKAGAYAIQETGDRYVEKVEGSFSNVVGLPLELLARMLKPLL